MDFKKFLDRLASAEPVPGGGSAAALTGSLGTALAEMVSRLNRKRRPSDRSALSLKRMGLIRRSFIRLMREDATAFGALRPFLKKGMRRARPAAYQKALRRAAEVPLRMCALAAEASELSRREKSRTSAWLMSDLREAEILLRAAFVSARLNVEINLSAVTDGRFRRSVNQKLKSLRRKIS